MASSGFPVPVLEADELWDLQEDDEMSQESEHLLESNEARMSDEQPELLLGTEAAVPLREVSAATTADTPSNIPAVGTGDHVEISPEDDADAMIASHGSDASFNAAADPLTWTYDRLCGEIDDFGRVPSKAVQLEDEFPSAPGDHEAVIRRERLNAACTLRSYIASSARDKDHLEHSDFDDSPIRDATLSEALSEARQLNSPLPLLRASRSELSGVALRKYLDDLAEKRVETSTESRLFAEPSNLPTNASSVASETQISQQNSQPQRALTGDALVAFTATGFWMLGVPDNDGKNVPNRARKPSQAGGTLFPTVVPSANVLGRVLFGQTDMAGKPYAASVSPTSFFAVAYSDVLNPPESFSIEVWAQPSKSSETGSIVSCESLREYSDPSSPGPAKVSTPAHGFHLEMSHEQVIFRIGNESVTQSFSDNIAPSRYELLRNKRPWTHVVAVYDNARRSMSVYVNAVSTRERAAVYEERNTESPLFFGACLTARERRFRGRLRSVAIYSKRLSDEEIAIRFQQGVDVRQQRVSTQPVDLSSLSSSLYSGPDREILDLLHLCNNYVQTSVLNDEQESLVLGSCWRMLMTHSERPLSDGVRRAIALLINGSLRSISSLSSARFSVEKKLASVLWTDIAQELRSSNRVSAATLCALQSILERDVDFKMDMDSFSSTLQVLPGSISEGELSTLEKVISLAQRVVFQVASTADITRHVHDVMGVYVRGNYRRSFGQFVVVPCLSRLLSAAPRMLESKRLSFDSLMDLLQVCGDVLVQLNTQALDDVEEELQWSIFRVIQKLSPGPRDASRSERESLACVPFFQIAHRLPARAKTNPSTSSFEAFFNDEQALELESAFAEVQSKAPLPAIHGIRFKGKEDEKSFVVALRNCFGALKWISGGLDDDKAWRSSWGIVHALRTARSGVPHSLLRVQQTCRFLLTRRPGSVMDLEEDEDIIGVAMRLITSSLTMKIDVEQALELFDSVAHDRIRSLDHFSTLVHKLRERTPRDTFWLAPFCLLFKQLLRGVSSIRCRPEVRLELEEASTRALLSALALCSMAAPRREKLEEVGVDFKSPNLQISADDDPDGIGGNEQLELKAVLIATATAEKVGLNHRSILQVVLLLMEHEKTKSSSKPAPSAIAPIEPGIQWWSSESSSGLSRDGLVVETKKSLSFVESTHAVLSGLIYFEIALMHSAHSIVCNVLVGFHRRRHAAQSDELEGCRLYLGRGVAYGALFDSIRNKFSVFEAVEDDVLSGRAQRPITVGRRVYECFLDASPTLPVYPCMHVLTTGVAIKTSFAQDAKSQLEASGFFERLLEDPEPEEMYLQNERRTNLTVSPLFQNRSFVAFDDASSSTSERPPELEPSEFNTQDMGSPAPNPGSTAASTRAPHVIRTKTLGPLMDETRLGSATELYACGQNAFAELGIAESPDSTSVTKPKRRLAESSLTSQLSPVDIACGNEFSAVLTSQGQVYTWGLNENGACGHGLNASYVPPSRIEIPTLVRGMQRLVVTKIRASNGAENVFAITSEGHLYGWGLNGWGQLGIGSTEKLIHTPSRVSLQYAVEDVSNSFGHTLVLTKPKAHVYSFGLNSKGQLGLGTQGEIRPLPQFISALSTRNQKVISVAVGMTHSSVVMKDGSVFAFGGNEHGQCGANPGEFGSMIVLPRRVEALGAVRATSTSCGYYYTMIVTSTGDLYSFGRGDFGQLGTGNSVSYQPSAVRVRKPFNGFVTSVSCGVGHWIALCSDGRIFASGRNKHGGVGDGSSADRLLPKSLVFPGALSSPVRVCAGFHHTLVLAANFGSVSHEGKPREDFQMVGWGWFGTAVCHPLDDTVVAWEWWRAELLELIESKLGSELATPEKLARLRRCTHLLLRCSTNVPARLFEACTINEFIDLSLLALHWKSDEDAEIALILARRCRNFKDWNFIARELLKMAGFAVGPRTASHFGVGMEAVSTFRWCASLSPAFTNVLLEIMETTACDKGVIAVLGGEIEQLRPRGAARVRVGGGSGGDAHRVLDRVGTVSFVRPNERIVARIEFNDSSGKDFVLASRLSEFEPVSLMSPSVLFQSLVSCDEKLITAVEWLVRVWKSSKESTQASAVAAARAIGTLFVERPVLVRDFVRRGHLALVSKWMDKLSLTTPLSSPEQVSMRNVDISSLERQYLRLVSTLAIESAELPVNSAPTPLAAQESLDVHSKLRQTVQQWRPTNLNSPSDKIVNVDVADIGSGVPLSVPVIVQCGNSRVAASSGEDANPPFELEWDAESAAVTGSENPTSTPALLVESSGLSLANLLSNVSEYSIVMDLAVLDFAKDGSLLEGTFYFQQFPVALGVLKRWRRVIVVKTGATQQLRLYVDGSLIPNMRPSIEAPNSAKLLIHGVRALVSNVQFRRYAMSEGEVKMLGGPSASLIPKPTVLDLAHRLCDELGLPTAWCFEALAHEDEYDDFVSFRDKLKEQTPVLLRRGRERVATLGVLGFDAASSALAVCATTSAREALAWLNDDSAANSRLDPRAVRALLSSHRVSNLLPEELSSPTALAQDSGVIPNARGFTRQVGNRTYDLASSSALAEQLVNDSNETEPSASSAFSKASGLLSSVEEDQESNDELVFDESSPGQCRKALDMISNELMATYARRISAAVLESDDADLIGNAMTTHGSFIRDYLVAFPDALRAPSGMLAGESSEGNEENVAVNTMRRKLASACASEAATMIQSVRSAQETIDISLASYEADASNRLVDVTPGATAWCTTSAKRVRLIRALNDAEYVVVPEISKSADEEFLVSIDALRCRSPPRLVSSETVLKAERRRIALERESHAWSRSVTRAVTETMLCELARSACEPRSSLDSGLFVSPPEGFKLIWSSAEPDTKKEDHSKSDLWIWRPVSPKGYVSMGDVMTTTGHPPTNVLVLSEDSATSQATSLLSDPSSFALVSSDEKFTIWRPMPRKGYVALGCVVVPSESTWRGKSGPKPPSLSGTVSCVHESCVAPSDLRRGFWSATSEESSSSSPVFSKSAWVVYNEFSSFVVRSSEQQTQGEMTAYRLLRSGEFCSSPPNPNLAFWLLRFLVEDVSASLPKTWRRRVFNVSLLRVLLRLSSDSNDSSMRALSALSFCVARASDSAKSELKEDFDALRRRMEHVYAQESSESRAAAAAASALDTKSASFAEIGLYSSALCALIELFSSLEPSRTLELLETGETAASSVFAPSAAPWFDSVCELAHVMELVDADPSAVPNERLPDAGTGLAHMMGLPQDFVMSEDTFLKFVKADDSRVLETRHPYAYTPGQPFENVFSIPSADRGLVVSFDKRSATSFGHGLELTTEPWGRRIETLQGNFGGARVHIQGNAFRLRFPVDEPLNWELSSSRKGGEIRLSNNNRTALMRKDKTWQTVLATHGFQSGINTWETLVDHVTSSSNIFFGCALKEADVKSYLGSDDKGWGWIGCLAVWHGGRKVKQPFGERLKSGDVVRCTLDCHRRTLSIAVNGVDCGVATDRLPAGAEFFPAFAFFNKHDQVTLLKGSQA